MKYLNAYASFFKQDSLWVDLQFQIFVYLPCMVYVGYRIGELIR